MSNKTPIQFIDSSREFQDADGFYVEESEIIKRFNAHDQLIEEIEWLISFYEDGAYKDEHYDDVKRVRDLIAQYK